MARILSSIAFVALLWSAIVVGLAGGACQPGFDLGDGLLWLEMYTLLGFFVTVPGLVIATTISYWISRWLPRKTIPLQLIFAIALPIAAFVYCVGRSHFDPAHPCVYP